MTSSKATAPKGQCRLLIYLGFGTIAVLKKAYSASIASMSNWEMSNDVGNAGSTSGKKGPKQLFDWKVDGVDFITNFDMGLDEFGINGLIGGDVNGRNYYQNKKNKKSVMEKKECTKMKGAGLLHPIGSLLKTSLLLKSFAAQPVLLNDVLNNDGTSEHDAVKEGGGDEIKATNLPFEKVNSGMEAELKKTAKASAYEGEEESIKVKGAGLLLPVRDFLKKSLQFNEESTKVKGASLSLIKGLLEKTLIFKTKMLAAKPIMVENDGALHLIEVDEGGGDETKAENQQQLGVNCGMSSEDLQKDGKDASDVGVQDGFKLDFFNKFSFGSKRVISRGNSYKEAGEEADNKQLKRSSAESLCSPGRANEEVGDDDDISHRNENITAAFEGVHTSLVCVTKSFWNWSLKFALGILLAYFGSYLSEHYGKTLMGYAVNNKGKGPQVPKSAPQADAYCTSNYRYPLLMCLFLCLCNVGDSLRRGHEEELAEKTVAQRVLPSKAKSSKSIANERETEQGASTAKSNKSLPSTAPTPSNASMPRSSSAKANKSADHTPTNAHSQLKPKVTVVTHAHKSTDDIFWTTWLDGAKAASNGADLFWSPVGYDPIAAASALNEGCNSTDAVVVTVPYAEGTLEYRIMDEAINSCIQMGIPVFTTNTDTYHNDKVYEYIGSSNYELGIKCGMSLLYPHDPDVVSGRKPAPPGPHALTDSAMKLQAYWDASDMHNEGLRLRLQGLNKTLLENGVDLSIFYPTGNEDCPCATEYPPGVSVEEGKGLTVTINEATYDYPPGYGMGLCSQHDKDLAPTCSSNDPPAFCNIGWCYVDPEKCDSSRFDLESIGEYVWSDFPGMELPYSYETCGNINQYESFFRDGSTELENDSVRWYSENTTTIVLNARFAPQFIPSVFICGEEAVQLAGIAQYGQSPFLQGINAVSNAIAAVVTLKQGLQWQATKGNSASTVSAEGFSMPISLDIFNNLSKHGKKVVETLAYYHIDRGITWDVWHDAQFDQDWILQHPPREYLGKSSGELPVPEICTEDDGDRKCDTDFQLYECSDEIPCRQKKFCPVDATSGPTFKDTCSEQMREISGDCNEAYFEAGMCKEVAATVSKPGEAAKKLCVGHSYGFYEAIYNHIIQAEKFVDITSLDSFDLMGTLTGVDANGTQFAAAVRNAIHYLAHTGREIHIKCHFGSVPSLDGDEYALSKENTLEMVRSLTRGFPSDTKVVVWVHTYRMLTKANWNHGKIVAVDGMKLIEGGSNYYTNDYLREDPVHDISMRVSGGPAITAHRYAEKLWRTSCEWWGFVPGNLQVEAAETSWYASGVYHSTTDDGFVGEIACPPAFDTSAVSETRPKTGVSVIPAARLGAYGGNLEAGSHTSDLAMLAMMEAAEHSIKFSQQDMLPLIIGQGPDWDDEVAWYNNILGSLPSFLFGNGGYVDGGGVSPTGFDDTWRIIGGLAKAIARGVDVHILVSAPCAFASNNPCDVQSIAMYLCPYDGTQGEGHDYWNLAYTRVTAGWKKWPDAREIDLQKHHIHNGEPLFHRRRDLSSSDQDRTRRLSYGYGWSLDNIADWIFAYMMINPDARPHGMNADEIVDHICMHAHIGHTRLRAEDETYTRGANRGGQVGNHAKVVMVDESIFYMGSDNAYGGGLAEFGLIVDDKEKAAELNEKYFGSLWHEALGTAESSLVSGLQSLDGKCGWRDRLPGRGAPWDHLQDSMCTTFDNGHGCQEAGCQWVSLLLPFTHCVDRPSGTYCNLNYGYCTLDLTPNGEFCLEDDTCESGRCSKWFKCEDKLSDGEVCLESEDCKGGYCGWTFTCGGVPAENGVTCSFDGSCRSGRCTAGLVCADKLQDGSSCGEDGDCVANHCTSTFSCGWKEDGESCGIDSDCIADHCNNMFNCGLQGIDEGCVLDSDCESDYCNNLFRCKAKKDNGAACATDGECKTDHCNSMFQCGRVSDGGGCLVDNGAEDETYTRGDYPGGQVGNHAKVVMVDDSIFYMRSDNAYGGGLAEFGLIIDDKDKAAELAEKYFGSL
ncbi:hypothetical protein ACHAWF_017058 [Thalassiosira exigua]